MLATLSAVLASTAVALQHAREDMYGIPAWGVALTIALGVASIAGCVLALTGPGTTPATAMAIAGVALVALGLLAILSIGVLALVAGVALLARAAPRPDGTRRGWLAAIVAGAPLPLLLIIALGDPIVSCSANGSSSGENLFMGFSSSGVSASSGTTPDGTSQGHAAGDSYAYSYECRDGKLVRFDLHWR